MSSLKEGDEVCMLLEDELIFGSLEYRKNDGNGDGKEERLWKVKWIVDPSRIGIKNTVSEDELIGTDRTVGRGAKVRIGSKIGICRGVLQLLDLRIIGTNTIIPSVRVEDVVHLKQYTQKSVVLYKGWLGVVTVVKREASVQETETTSGVYKLNDLIPNSSGLLMTERHWINEMVENTKYLPKNSANQNGCPAPKKPRLIGLIKDLIIDSVKVHWIHQIDPEYPDKPREEFKGPEIYKLLQLIKEGVADDGSAFSFEVGNLCRYTISSQADFLRWDDWQRKLARKSNFPVSVQEKLQTASKYVETLPNKYWRVYETTNFNVESMEEVNGNEIKKQPQIEEKLAFGKTVVVEIAHISTVPDILWQDNTSEMPSSFDLEMIEDTFLSDEGLPQPGDFITSNKLEKYPPDSTYCVVLRREETSSTSGHPKLVVKVLSTEVPGKVLANSVDVIGDLRLSAKLVERHPTFQYFNESSTIVVVNDIGPDGIQVRIGNVIGTNLLGKVNVRFLGGSSHKDEWIWPQTCAIYSVKGYDLECIKSHVVDTDSDKEVETKLRSMTTRIETKVDLIWKNNSKTESDLSQSLAEFSFIFNSLKNISTRLKHSFHHPQYTALSDYLARPVGVAEGCRPSFLKDNACLLSLVTLAIKECQTQIQTVLGTPVNGEEQVPDIEMIDLTKEKGPDDVDPLSEYFAATVRILDYHPEGHKFAKSTNYNPWHNRSFVNLVKKELENLKKMCSTECQAEIGILSRAYADRMDLLSFLIRGPAGTPYEDSLYIFDAYLPPNYPEVPPQFHFHAFKAGRLNPNLYAEGRVCVSLLGTWEGRDEREKWTKDSSIVQILLSIQALILVREPYHNEPGLEAEKYTASQARSHCKTYNTELMPLIVQMMINQIEFGMEPWTDQINAFYKTQVPRFIARWRLWLAATSEAALKDEKPEFALFPTGNNGIDSGLKTRMNPLLERLEAIWKQKLTDTERDTA